MITRRRYSTDFKKKIAMELLANESSLAQVSEREGIACQTLSKWKTQFAQEGFYGEEDEVLELRRQVADLKSAVSDLVLENQILKKTQDFIRQQRKKESLSGTVSLPISGSKKAAKR